jgi:hypothetical protein
MEVYGDNEIQYDNQAFSHFRPKVEIEHSSTQVTM